MNRYSGETVHENARSPRIEEETDQNLVRISGEARKAIVFEEDPSAILKRGMREPEDIFAEMRPFMVDVPDVDDSREAIYTRVEGERSSSTHACWSEQRGRTTRIPVWHARPSRLSGNEGGG